MEFQALSSIHSPFTPAGGGDLFACSIMTPFCASFGCSEPLPLCRVPLPTFDLLTFPSPPVILDRKPLFLAADPYVLVH